MDRILTRTCTAEQCGVFMRNSWRYACVGNTHICIHPPTSDVPVLPPGPVRHVATIEILDSVSEPWGRAEQAAVDAVITVFGSALSGSGG